MPHLETDDNVKLYYEEAGKGTPIIFVHEFARNNLFHQVRYTTPRCL